MLNPARAQPFALFLDHFNTGECGTTQLISSQTRFRASFYFPTKTKHTRKTLYIAEVVVSRSDCVYSPLMWSYKCFIMAHLCRSSIVSCWQRAMLAGCWSRGNNTRFVPLPANFSSFRPFSHV
ncbi:putative 41.2 kDa protein in cps region [Labeo rohita]|uniref:41.2 kDa protein in cps region n=1 Tax=Labeo rohita TaxID=84645 RepID=A0ABQ8M5R9_LABRO|nr:putative 41.2 kDa protein in cps region [Labeo rohita]